LCTPFAPLPPPLTFVGANDGREHRDRGPLRDPLDGREPVLKLVGARPRRRLEQELAAFI
jgi:hypothetical protein